MEFKYKTIQSFFNSLVEVYPSSDENNKKRLKVTGFLFPCTRNPGQCGKNFELLKKLVKMEYSLSAEEEISFVEIE
jgi:hypothetical protein